MRKSWAVLFLILVTLITVAFCFTLPQTHFDYEFNSFFKPDDEPTQYFEQHQKTFGTDNDFILIGLISNSGVFDPGFITQLEKLTPELKKLPYVRKVISPTTLKTTRRAPLIGTIFQTGVLRGNREKDSLRVFSDPSLIDNIFSKDTTAVSIVLITDPGLSKAKSDAISEALHHTLSQFHFDGVHLAGRAIGQVVFVNKIQKEFGLFLVISLLFIVVLLFIMFRSFRGVILPLATVLIAVVWAIGILNLSGKGISILLNMLPPVILVVGMSDAVHLYSRYLEELRSGASKAVAIHEMVFDTGLAAFFTSLTTAIGFASLYLTGIPALQDFGIFTAAGVMSAYIVAITLLPACLVLTKIPEKSVSNTKGNWEGWLTRFLRPVIRYRKWVLGISLFLAVSLSFVVSHLQLNSFILEDLKPDEPLRKDFAFFDTNFAGVRPFELGVKLKDSTGTILSKNNLIALAKVESELKKKYDVHAINSPLTAVKEINRMRHNGNNESYTLPDSERDWKNVEKDLQEAQKLGKLKHFITRDGQYARISGRTEDRGAQYFDQADLDLDTFISNHNLDRDLQFEVTGTGTLIDRTNQNLVWSLGKGLGAAFVLIAILMGFMFRSFKMMIIALIPNILPLLALGGVMVLFGINLKMSTSIIFTIAFGIAVDDTIHLLSRYRLEMSKGNSRQLALKSAFVHTGKSVIMTSIILFGGFITLCFSSFQSTFYVGLLVTLTLLFALIFDLILLPALLARKSDAEKLTA